MINKNNQLNITIFSYNIFWKIMKNTTSPLVKTMGKDKLKKYKFAILKNIYLTKKYYDPFFYCIQEAEGYASVIKLFDQKNYDYHVGFSNPEYILTIWKKKIFKKKIVIDGEFEKGRPYSLFIFEDLRFKVDFILVNIHPGHHHDTLETLFKPIQSSIDSNIEIIKKFNIKRIIIGGDFNRDIGSQIELEPKKYSLNINLTFYYFNSFSNNNKTCCSLTGYGHNKNYDQVIDSLNKPIQLHQLNIESWYNSKSSDHIAILAVIKNFI